MDVLHINAFDLKGGASRAAYRIHKSLLKYENKYQINSLMRVIYKSGDDISILGGSPIGTSPFWTKIVPYINKISRIGFKTENPIAHSSALVNTGMGKELQNRYKKNKSEIINLHWIGDIAISLNEISNLKQKKVWTLHDQWAFCGAEHYENLYDIQSQTSEKRYIDGYLRKNRPKEESGIDINKLVWNIKIKALKNSYIICNSQWLADCARNSYLMRNLPIEVIPIPLDLQKYSPLDKYQARNILNLPSDPPLILFGAIGGTRDPRKGSDLLLKALMILKDQEKENSYISSLELIIFGENDQLSAKNNLFPTHYFGHLNDDISLKIIYSAVNLLVVPSRLEALGQTGIEAHACGTPVVAFNTGGLIDVVEDKVTGSLSEPFDPYSLAREIKWVIENKTRNNQLCKNARSRAEKIWSQDNIAKLYSNVYRKILNCDQ